MFLLIPFHSIRCGSDIKLFFSDEDILLKQVKLKYNLYNSCHILH